MTEKQEGWGVSDPKHGWFWSASRVFLGHFVPCAFGGLLTVHVPLLVLDLQSGSWSKLAVALLNGCLVGIAVFIIHLGRMRRVNREIFPGRDRAYRLVSTGSGFLCGALIILVYQSPIGMVILTGLILLAIAFHIKLFLLRVAHLLRPGRFARIEDVVFLASMFGMLLIAFTLVHISIDHLHTGLEVGSDSEQSSVFSSLKRGSLVDHLYFSIVVMTTLGFGDISPLTPMARIAVAVECLTSYVMFALMLGVITRGIIFRGEEVE